MVIGKPKLGEALFAVEASDEFAGGFGHRAWKTRGIGLDCGFRRSRGTVLITKMHFKRFHAVTSSFFATVKTVAGLDELNHPRCGKVWWSGFVWGQDIRDPFDVEVEVPAT